MSRIIDDGECLRSVAYPEGTGVAVRVLSGSEVLDRARTRILFFRLAGCRSMYRCPRSIK